METDLQGVQKDLPPPCARNPLCSSKTVQLEGTRSSAQIYAVDATNVIRGDLPPLETMEHRHAGLPAVSHH